MSYCLVYKNPSLESQIEEVRTLSLSNSDGLISTFSIVVNFLIINIKEFHCSSNYQSWMHNRITYRDKNAPMCDLYPNIYLIVLYKWTQKLMLLYGSPGNFKAQTGLKILNVLYSVA